MTRAAAFLLLLALALDAQPRKKVLAIGAAAGYQHDETTDGLATIWKLGKETGLWDTFIRTDTQLITKKKLPLNAKNLDFFDAVVFYTTGELAIDDEQKAALMSFIHDDGKGFVGLHSAIDTFYKWPQFGEMTGAWFENHPWGVFQAPVIVEDPNFPAMKAFPREFVIEDEIYEPTKDFSREKTRVLARLDETKIDLKNPLVKRTDKDFPVAWAKMYGKGRVFYSTFGHTAESWTRPDVQAMYREAVKWSLGLIPGDATPRPRP
ncbi:MAG TPA: ThuA domain-containing protein [Bryobacteraceae bacterium]|jgi:type 1 glutamine amidotransferase|nr:ThuA domain-containing protein [Bryobacteraceae bacterium]